MPFTTDSTDRLPSIADIGIIKHIDNKAQSYTAKRQSAIHLDSELFIALVANEVSVAAIARIWGVSRQTIHSWVNQYNYLTK